MRSVLAAIALASVAGCYREKPAPAPPPANRVEEPKPVASDDLLAYLPVDADLVVGVELNLLRQAQLYRTFEKQLLDAFGKELAAAQRCGVDPARALQRVTIAGKIDDSKDFDGVVVFRGVDTALALPCIAREAASKGKVESSGDLVVVTGTNAEDSFAAATSGSSTLVVQISHTASRATIASVLGSGAPLRTSPAFMTLFGRREANAAVWGMVNGNAPFMASAKMSGISPKSMDGTLRVTDELTAVLRMTMPSPADADQLVQSAQAMLPSARSMLSRLEVQADGAVVRFDAAATEPQIRALAGMMGAFGP
jgi:hypothetical protein